MPVVAGVSDTSASVTFDVVARAPANESLARTLAMTFPPVLEDALTESFTAVTAFSLTVTVAVAWSQSVGWAISQIPYASTHVPIGVPLDAAAEPHAGWRVTH